MAKPNRELLHPLLEAAAEVYPHGIDPKAFYENHSKETVTATIHYLEAHELLSTIPRKRIGTIESYAEITLTHQGVDYLAEDGGLSAELGVVTVRFEAQTIRELIMAHVELSQASKHQKNLLRRQLEALPEEGLRQLASQLIHRGLQGVPNTIEWLQRLIGP